jgi:RND family efflux transporter MFP subunit
MNLRQSGPMKSTDAREPTTGIQASPLTFRRTVAAVVALFVVGVVAGLVPRFHQQSELAAGTMELSIPTVTVVSPKPGKPESSMPLPAQIKPWAEAPIYARANGYLKRRLVDIGSHVKEGRLLAEIDTPELDQELERDRALLAQAEAALGLAKVTAARWADLVKKGSVSDQENDEKQADLRLKAATVESARAEVHRQEKLLSFTRITAPFDGIITARNIDAGDLIVAASGKELFHLVQTRRLRVYVQVPQSMARGIRPGQSAEMTVPELPGRTFPAKVVRTAGVIAEDSRTLLVELRVDNPKEQILAGSYAQVGFTEAKVESALTLPANTVLFRAEGPQIGVVQEHGQVELRTVKLGRDFGKTIEVLTGVGPEDRVIVNPSDSLASGATVYTSETTEKGRDK